MGRSTRDLIELVEYFENKGVKLISIKENFDTATPIYNKIFLIDLLLYKIEIKNIVRC